MARTARPEDLASFVVPTDPNLSPDGRTVAFVAQTTTARRDGYRHAIWAAPADGSAPARRLTIGWRHDISPRWSPDGGTLAFISDRRTAVEDPAGEPEKREDASQVHLLPVDGGEARRLTDLPRGVDAFAWSPDGTRLAVVSSSLGATRGEDARLRRRPKDAAATEPLLSDYRYMDRLGFQFNGRGFLDGPAAQLWVVDVATGAARRLTAGEAAVESPAWSPDGRSIAFSSDRDAGRDLRWSADIWVVDVDGPAPRPRRVTGGSRHWFGAPAWLPDGRRIAALGHRYPVSAGARSDVWIFAADGSEPSGGTNLTARHDLMIGAGINSDVTIGEGPRLLVTDGGRSILFLAPDRGSQVLRRVDVRSGDVERLTPRGRTLSAVDAAAGGEGLVVAAIRCSATELPEVCAGLLGTTAGKAKKGDAADGKKKAKKGADGLALRLVTDLNGPAVDGLALSAPVEMTWTVDGRTIQGWWYPPLTADGAPAPLPGPLVLQIHGGPMTAYGNAPFWEWQVLAGAGMGVLAANPRGSDGYGQAFAQANVRDWGAGPTADLLAGVDVLLADGRADAARLGVTGGSYGGYLTSWIVGHDDRFAAAITCRSVNDLAVLMGTGDIAGPQFGEAYFGAQPWEDPAIYREQSPITYAAAIRTPLLIQHAEQDLRTTIAQAELLFTALRTMRRPVRLMRVPGESHELTRSGTPFRRVENIVQVRDWFAHFLVAGKKGLPPKPAARAGL
jgi:dipeptidyl aminopeptidase/acylaminoacyl peptidase